LIASTRRSWPGWLGSMMDGCQCGRWLELLSFRVSREEEAGGVSVCEHLSTPHATRRANGDHKHAQSAASRSFLDYFRVLPCLQGACRIPIAKVCVRFRLQRALVKRAFSAPTCPFCNLIWNVINRSFISAGDVHCRSRRKRRLDT
jgi:hypothetical protein